MSEQMKPSGIDWIRDIPESWKVKPIAYMTKSRSGGTPNRNNLLYWENGTIPWMSSGEVNKVNIYDTDEKITTLAVHHSSAKIISKNAVMVALNGQGKTKGMSAILRIDSACNQSLCAFSCNAGILYYEYLFWCFQTMYTYLRQMSGDDVRDGLAASYVKKQNVPVPKYEEQQAIADFLDKECAQIDSIAADLEKQIALLQQYKKSLITETVTKGLDKSVPMKDSGVEWASKIPCHWEIKRFKYLCEYITDGSHFSPETTDEGYPYITAADVKGVGLDYDAAKKISQQDFISLQKAGCQPRRSDVLLVKDGATTGRIGMVTSEKPCVVLSSVAILRAPDNMDARYLRYLMESDFVQAQIQASMAGSAMPRTVLSKIINYWGITCPKEEQKEICDFLDRKCGYIETVIETKQVQQSTIQQHKKSLIYEYVTGKKRVKEVQ